MIKEIWKDVTGYEGLYQVSNLGKVKSLKFGKERILKPRVRGKGYLFVDLCKNGKTKAYSVHRLVALTFLENKDPLNKTQVNHIDECKTNNRIDNLEWCTPKENNNHGTHNYRSAINRSKPVLQFTKYGVFVKEWDSAKSIQITLGFYNSNISKCCNKKRKSAYNFIWKFKN